MTERELYIQCIPQIAEMVYECRKMDMQDYEDWKRETLEAIPETTIGFYVKVFSVIDPILRREGVL